MSLAEQSQQWFPTSVQVTVLQARGLRIKGKNGTNDAYAIMQVSKERFSTSVAEKSVAPMWNEEATFDLPPSHQGSNAERCTLRVHVMHRALVGADKLLGQAVVNLLELSSVKSRNKTEWFKLLDKAGKPEKDRGEVLLDVQFTRNNMTASMFDLAGSDKPRSRLGKLKDKVRGKKTDGQSDAVPATAVVPPPLTQVLTDSEGEEEEEGGEKVSGKDVKKRKLKIKSLFSSKSNLQRNLSQSMSVLPPLPEKNASLSGSRSSGLNVDSSEGKKKFRFGLHKRSGSSDSRSLSLRSNQSGPLGAEPSTVCVNGSHMYCEEPRPRTWRLGSDLSLASSGHGSMEELRRPPPGTEGSLSSSDSTGGLKQCSPWTEEEEEEEEEDVGRARDDDDDEEEEEEKEEKKSEFERRREMRLLEERQREEEDRIRLRNEEERRRKEEEQAQEEKKVRVEEEKKRREEKIKREEEKVRMEERKKREEEEERVRMEEEQRIKAEEERAEEEKKRKEEVEKVRVEKERQRREEERVRMEEERKTREDEKFRMEEMKRIQEEEEKKQREIIREEERKREEQQRIKAEEERAEDEKKRKEKVRVEEERKRQDEERVQMVRKNEEERVRMERKMQEERKLEEERIRMEGEMERSREEARRREEENVRMENERKRREERKREEEEEMVRIEEMEERKRIEEARQEEERVRREQEGDRLSLEAEKGTREQMGEVEGGEKKAGDGQTAREEVCELSGLRSGGETPPGHQVAAEVSSRSGPFDDTSSTNPFEEPPASPPGPPAKTARVSAVKPRYHASMPLVGNKDDLVLTAGCEGKDSGGAPRDKRPAPQPPGGTRANRLIKREQKDDQEAKTPGVFPQRLVQMIAPLSRSCSEDQSRTPCGNYHEDVPSSIVAKHGKGPAPAVPQSSSIGEKIFSQTNEHKPSYEPSKVLFSNATRKDNMPNERASAAKYGYNPFEDDETEMEVAGQDEVTPGVTNLTVSHNNPSYPPVNPSCLSVCAPVAQTPKDDGVSQTKSKSWKTSRAPMPPVKKAATSGVLQSQETDLRPKGAPRTMPSDSQPVAAQKSGEEAGGNWDGSASNSRSRPHAVKPLEPQAITQGTEDDGSTVFLCSTREKIMVKDVALKGPYSQLSQAELISLVLKQQNQLSEREKKVTELEKYIDNLLVRVMEENPSILMSLSALK